MQLAAAALFVVACSAPASPPIANQGSQTSRSLAVSLERTACFGRCPTYTVTIAPDGAVEWTGTANVKVTGEQRAQLEPAALVELEAGIERAKFFDLDEHGDPKQPDPVCTKSGKSGACDFRESVICSDTPHAITVVTRSGNTHRVDNDHCVARPVDELEALIDKLAGTAAWI